MRRRYRAVKQDQRAEFERDRDRILYSSAFRRLSGITQIVRAGEADVFHTRQQHTIKVAQVGRRLAQNCVREQPDLADRVGLNPEVVEASCLAHDLGHPPFGHVGEHLLDVLVRKHGDDNGFEGNAQSFRILTKLAVRFVECTGLDLTRAALAACLKYPWLRNAKEPSRSKKWGAYDSEKEDFEFARELFQHSAKTAEADLMDWADDIAYSVHDLEDFHRCGVLPWHRILEGDQSDQILRRALESWYGKPMDAEGRLRDAFRNLNSFLRGSFPQLINEPYDGSLHQRQQLRTMTSRLIGRYIGAARLTEPDAMGKCVAIAEDEADEVLILKQITRDYIISNPALAAQQKGQERILETLFECVHTDSQKEPPKYLPNRLRYLWDIDGRPKPARFVSDCIASLTEGEAVALHGRLHGIASGSVLDPIVR
ncbi:deoxyguanosinetriphosphate triphosphohydrolase family protein [Bradyrhizobium arachidis]|uniref:deoxyguanosinetriphosphate triphosphohydrolase family protein n=1 Tax=Bradyrhizobium arachidis TaxID=858423 RepID=UPI0021620FD3|nr:dNTP triphosphohydrolase [Bradyrhizobium arachidis]